MKPARMPIVVENIPPELIERKNWVVWRWEQRDGNWTKPPYQVNGRPAKSNDPETWSEFNQALKTFQNGGAWDGIGFMLADGCGLAGVDWDDCLNAAGEIEPEILKHAKAINSYTEISPSGRGLKTLLGGRLPKGGHHGAKIGVFDSVRYFCVTGRVVPYFSPKIEQRQPQLEALVRELWPGDFSKPKAAQKPRPMPEALADDEVIAKALAAHNGAKFRRLWEGDWSAYPSQSDADQALCNCLAFWTGRDSERMDRLFRQSGLNRDKWESREDYRRRTIGKAIDQAGEVYEPRRRPPEPPPLSETAEEREAIQSEPAARNDSSERPSASFIIDRIHSQGDSKGGNREGQHKNPEPEGQQRATKGNKGQHEIAIQQIAIGLIKSGMPLATIQKHIENLHYSQEWLEISKQIFDSAKFYEKGLTEAVRDFVGATWGNISATNALQSATKGNTPELRKQVRVILGRLVSEGVLERVPGKDGIYRKVENECPDIDFMTADDQALNLWLPLGLNHLAETMPGNIIVFSGVPDAGKTAFLLNTARYNWDRFKIFYFSSEMGESELKKRLKNFNDTSLSDWKAGVRFKERSGDFADVIKPGKGIINIIDFLEVHKDFYEVGEKLAAIHCKLKGAIAVIAMQKNPGAETGLGGWRGVEKPRLYVNIEKSNICTVVKAKNWATTENPNGKQTRFKIYGGCNLTQVGGWHYPQKK